MSCLRLPELSEMIDRCPIVYIPCGIYEWHRQHIPMGTDTLKMEEICKRTVQRTGGLIHMPSYIGVGTFDKAINFSPNLVKNYFCELFYQLEKIGIKLIVQFYGHTPVANVNPHEEAACNYMLDKNTKTKVLCLNDLEPVVKHRYKVADHAAKWETSFMMASEPDHVSMRAIGVDQNSWCGLNPCIHASADEGNRMYDLIAGETAKIVEMALNAPKENIANYSFMRTSKCWENCQNIDDLENDFWKGDSLWEDPWCWCCIWRSPGIIKTIIRLKGVDWMKQTMKKWTKTTEEYTGRARVAIEQLQKELDEFVVGQKS